MSVAENAFEQRDGLLGLIDQHQVAGVGDLGVGGVLDCAEDDVGGFFGQKLSWSARRWLPPRRRGRSSTARA